jgi:hypothetical protein
MIGLYKNPIMFRCDAAFRRSAGLFATNNAVRCTFEINSANGIANAEQRETYSAANNYS